MDITCKRCGVTFDLYMNFVGHKKLTCETCGHPIIVEMHGGHCWKYMSDDYNVEEHCHGQMNVSEDHPGEYTYFCDGHGHYEDQKPYVGPSMTATQALDKSNKTYLQRKEDYYKGYADGESSQEANYNFFLYDTLDLPDPVGEGGPQDTIRALVELLKEVRPYVRQAQTMAEAHHDNPEGEYSGDDAQYEIMEETSQLLGLFHLIVGLHDESTNEVSEK